MGAPPDFEVLLLGYPKVLRGLGGGAAEEVVWPLRRALLLLAYLAMQPDFEAGRDELAEAGWWSEDEERVRKNFHPTLSLLRRSLDPTGTLRPLIYRNGTYRLNAALAWQVDLVEFDTRRHRGQALVDGGQGMRAAAEWEAAWRLCRGPLMAGHEAPWLDERRQRHQREALELRSRLGEVWVQLGERERARDALRSVLVEDPLREDVHLALMRLYAAEGRRDLVRRSYGRLCEVLLAELGAEPAPETVEEVHRLLS